MVIKEKIRNRRKKKGDGRSVRYSGFVVASELTFNISSD